MFIDIIINILLTSVIWKRKIIPKIGASGILCLVFLLPNLALASSINASELIKLTNEKRAEEGLEYLTPNHYLTQAAHKKASDMIENQYFAHTTPKGKPFYEWIEENGYHYLYAGENLAIDFKTNQATVKAWMESPTHRANILNNNYTDIGLVTLRGEWEGRETIVVVQMFGSLLTDGPTVLGKTLENLSSNLGIRKNSLKEMASDLVMLPSIAGNTYFDILLKPEKETAITASNPSRDSIAQSPITKVVQGNSYQTLLKTKNDCCSKEATFALTEQKQGNLLTTPISYPSLTALLSSINTPKFLKPMLPKTLYNNLLIAGLLSILLLASYEQEIKKELTVAKKKT